MWVACLRGLIILCRTTSSDEIAVDELAMGTAPITRAAGAGGGLPELILGEPASVFGTSPGEWLGPRLGELGVQGESGTAGNIAVALERGMSVGLKMLGCGGLKGVPTIVNRDVR